MINLNVLAIVPARCGSKGFPNKNIVKLQGETLLGLAVKVGVNCEAVDATYVSTDCVSYNDIAVKAGAISLGLRPDYLAADKAKTVDVAIDLIQKLENIYDYLVLLQPTSPVREPKDITNMIALLDKSKADACVSVVRLEEPHPYKLKSISDDGYIKSFIDDTSSEVPRQELPKAYALNGSIYVVKIQTLLKERTFLPYKTVPYYMESCVNIDSEEDFIFLNAMIDAGKINVWSGND